MEDTPQRRKRSSNFYSGYTPLRKQSSVGTGLVGGDSRRLTIRSTTVQNHPLLKLLAFPNDSLEQGREIYQLIKDFAFMKTLFKENALMKEEDKYQLCTKLKVEGYQRGHIIFREGAQSNDKMYVIIVGRVAVLLKKHAAFIQPQPLPGNTKRMSLNLNQEFDVDSYLRMFGTLINEIGEG